MLGDLVKLGAPMAIKSASVQISKLFVNSWINPYGVTDMNALIFGSGNYKINFVTAVPDWSGILFYRSLEEGSKCEIEKSSASAPARRQHKSIKIIKSTKQIPRIIAKIFILNTYAGNRQIPGTKKSLHTIYLYHHKNIICNKNFFIPNYS